jgi:hypothetical protein
MALAHSLERFESPANCGVIGIMVALFSVATNQPDRLMGINHAGVQSQQFDGSTIPRVVNVYDNAAIGSSR